MSKLVNQIKAIGLNEKRVSDWLELKSTFTIDNDDLRLGTSLYVMRNYDITVKLGATVAINESQHDHLSNMVNKVKRAVIEELYGEFRKPLLLLELNIAEGSRQKSLELVKDIQDTMFGRNI